MLGRIAKRRRGSPRTAVRGLSRRLEFLSGHSHCRQTQEQFVEASLEVRHQIAKRHAEAVPLMGIAAAEICADRKCDGTAGRREGKQFNLPAQLFQASVRGGVRKAFDLHQHRRPRHDCQIDADRQRIARFIGQPAGDPQGAANVVQQRLMIDPQRALLLRKEDHKRRHRLGRRIRCGRRGTDQRGLRALRRGMRFDMFTSHIRLRFSASMRYRYFNRSGTAGNHSPAVVERRVPSTRLWNGLLTVPPLRPKVSLVPLETFGRANGMVGRPCHNKGKPRHCASAKRIAAGILSSGEQVCVEVRGEWLAAGWPSPTTHLIDVSVHLNAVGIDRPPGDAGSREPVLRLSEAVSLSAGVEPPVRLRIARAILEIDGVELRGANRRGIRSINQRRGPHGFDAGINCLDVSARHHAAADDHWVTTVIIMMVMRKIVIVVVMVGIHRRFAGF